MDKIRLQAHRHVMNQKSAQPCRHVNNELHNHPVAVLLSLCFPIVPWLILSRGALPNIL